MRSDVILKHLETLHEHKMAKYIFVPVLKAMGLKGVKYTGGTDEQGIDIEYYELTEPEKTKKYVGVQFKKGDLVYSGKGSKNSIKEIKNQAEEAFEKEIHDLNDNSVHCISRFIVATTGEINEKARVIIGRARQKGMDGQIHYWDGERLVKYIQQYWLDQFIEYFKIDNKEIEESLDEINNEIEEIDKKNIKKILKIILTDNLVQHYDIELDIEDINLTEKIKVAKFLLRNYPTYYNAYAKSLSIKRNKLTNVETALQILFSSTNITSKIYHNYYKFYIENPESSYLKEFLWEEFKRYYSELGIEKKEKFENALLGNFIAIFDSWIEENRLTMVVEYIWNAINSKTKSKFFELYLEIYFCRNRKDKFEQKQFASEIVPNPENEETIKKWIEGNIIKEIESNSLVHDDIEYEIKYFTRHYYKAKSLLSLSKEDWLEYVSGIYEKNVNPS